MNLDGKYVILTVQDGAEHLLLVDAPEGDLLLFGKIAGETVNVGLWMTVLVWAGTDGVEHRPARSDETRLVQWRLIRAAKIVPDGTDPKTFGFKLAE